VSERYHQLVISGASERAVVSRMTGSKKLTREEVSSHNDANSTWLVIDNAVYDVTKFLNEVSEDFLQLD
jgi:cytochrome b involved in lipid metabolism